MRGGRLPRPRCDLDGRVHAARGRLLRRPADDAARSEHGGSTAGPARARRERPRSAGFADGAVGRYLQGCDRHLSRRPGVRRTRRLLGPRTVHPARHVCAAGHARPRAGRTTVDARRRRRPPSSLRDDRRGARRSRSRPVFRASCSCPRCGARPLLPVRITTESGFVPADTRRRLRSPPARVLDRGARVKRRRSSRAQAVMRNTRRTAGRRARKRSPCAAPKTASPEPST